MIRMLAYLAIFGSPVFFFAFFKDYPDNLVASELISFIIQGGLVLYIDEKTYRKWLVFSISAVSLFFLCLFTYRATDYLSRIEFEYLSLRSAGYLISSLVLCVSMLILLYWCIRKTIINPQS